jgi:ribosomal protein S27AE
MHEFEDTTEAMRLCSRCGGNAFFWRTAIVAGNPAEPRGSAGAQTRRQPAWTCMSCGYMEPDERHAAAMTVPVRDRGHL